MEPSIRDIFVDAHNTASNPAKSTFIALDNSEGQVDAIRVGNQALTMTAAKDMGGDEGDGFGYLTGVFDDDDTFEATTELQWADSPEDARKAVQTWLEKVSA